MLPYIKTIPVSLKHRGVQITNLGEREAWCRYSEAADTLSYLKQEKKAEKALIQRQVLVPEV